MQVAAPLQQNVTEYLYVTGTVQAEKSVNMVARVEGTLESIGYKDGAKVKKGQTLFQIDPAQYKAAVKQAQGSVDQSKAKLLNTQLEYQRQSKLGQKSYASQAVVDTARANMDMAQGELEAAQGNLTQSKLNLGYTTVTAPFDGVATAHEADVGALVGQGSPTTLATLVSLDPIWINFTISQNAVQRIRQRLKREGKSVRSLGPIPVQAQIPGGNSYPFHGTVDYIAPQIDASTGTLAVRGVFNNGDGGLLPGMFVRVRVPTHTLDKALLVPAAAIGTSQQGRYVFTVDDKNIAHETAVEVARGPGDYEVITKGLKPTDKVVVGGLERVVAESKIVPEPIKLAPPKIEAVSPGSAGGASKAKGGGAPETPPSPKINVK